VLLLLVSARIIISSPALAQAGADFKAITPTAAILVTNTPGQRSLFKSLKLSGLSAATSSVSSALQHHH
jgi:hypothetical protein